MIRAFFFTYILLLFMTVDLAYAESTVPEKVEDHDHAALANDQPPGVVEKGGQFVPLTAVFNDENGNEIALGKIIDRPTLLLPVYYYCPTTCSFDMANLADALRETKIDTKSFRVITMSFNEKEPPQAAANARNNFLRIAGENYPPENWFFLTGNKENILKVTQSIGYTFKPAPNNMYIHPSAIAVLSGEGKIIKYVYGKFLSGDVDLALSEAEKGTPTTSIRRFLAFCFSSDPKQNQKVFTFLKVSAFLILGLGATFFIRFLIKDNKEE